MLNLPMFSRHGSRSGCATVAAKASATSQASASTHARSNKIVAAFASLSLVLCAASFAAQPTQAYADSQLTINVPTTVACALADDGSIVTPSNWKIENNMTETNVRISGVTLTATQTNTPDINATVKTGETTIIEAALSKANMSQTSNSVFQLDAGVSAAIDWNIAFANSDSQEAKALIELAKKNPTSFMRFDLTYTNATDLAGKVSITGDPMLGNEVEASIAGMQEGAVPAYQWYRNGVAIDGATAVTYTITADDVDQNLTVRVTDKGDMGYLGAIESDPVVPYKMYTFAVYSAQDGSLNFYYRQELPTVDSTFNGLKVTAVYDGIDTLSMSDPAQQPWKAYRDSIKTSTVVDDGVKPVSCACWFTTCKNLTKVDFTKLDTSSATSMVRLFDDCESITDITFGEKFTTSNVADMDCMFANCDKLEKVDVSGFDTSNVTCMSYMFSSDYALKSVDVSNFNTEKVTDIKGMFNECKSISTLDLSSFNTKSVKSGNEIWVLRDMTSAMSITVGEGWVKSIEFPKAGLSEDGKWYEKTSYTEYNYNAIPTGVAATYTLYDPSVFAVYSADDNSLNFYKDVKVPAVGETYRDLTVTNVYPEVLSVACTSEADQMWAAERTLIKTTTVVDEVAPISTAYWFSGMNNLETADLTNLNTAGTKAHDGMFAAVSKLGKISVGTGWQCKIDFPKIEGGESHTGIWYDQSTESEHEYNAIPLGVAETYSTRIAFAVWDANSYDGDTSSVEKATMKFYKRTSDKVPSVGDTYDGLYVSAIYTGIESGKQGPWVDTTSTSKRTLVMDKTAKVEFVDEGISPVSTNSWFQRYTPTTGRGFISLVGLDKLDTSKTTDMSLMFTNCSGLKTIDFASLDTSKVTSMWAMFEGCTSLESFDGTSLDTSSLQNAKSMFENCTGLKSVNLNGFVKSSLTDTDRMFYGCTGLTEIDMSSWDTTGVTDMSYMFAGCTGIAKLDFSVIDTSKATNMSFMLQGCTGLASVNFEGFKTSSVSNFKSLFSGCTGLTKLDLSSFDFSGITSVENIGNIFYGCSGLEEITTGDKWLGGEYGVDFPCVGKSAGGKWYNTATGEGYAYTKVPGGDATYSITSPKIVFAVYSDEGHSLKFYNRTGVPTAGSTYDYVKVTKVYTGFTTSTDSAPWYTDGSIDDVSLVEVVDDGIAPVSMKDWFHYSESSTKLTVITGFTKLDTSNVTNMSGLFQNCAGFTKIAAGGSNLSVDLTKFNTSKVTDMSHMFDGCAGIKEFDFTGTTLDTSKVTNFNYMLANCSNLEYIDMSGLDDSSAQAENHYGDENIVNMFVGDSKLATIVIGDKWVKRMYFPHEGVSESGIWYNKDGVERDYTKCYVDDSLKDMGYIAGKYTVTNPSTPSTDGDDA